MPRDLPGMYWDEEKRRYFPLSSRRAGKPPTAPASVPHVTLSRSQLQSLPKRSRKRKLQIRDSLTPPLSSRLVKGFKNIDGWHALNTVRQYPVGLRSRRCLHDIQIDQLSANSIESHLSDSGPLPVDIGQTITALCSKPKVDTEGGNLWIGDDAGWLYRVNTKTPDHNWRELSLGTQITSITRSKSITLVTSLGSPARLLVTREETLGHWLLREFPTHVCSDVWCGQVFENTIVVGGRRGAVFFLDAEQDEYLRLRSSSDVFSLSFQNQNIVYIGLRNGVIERWDLRQPSTVPDLIVDMSQNHKTTGRAPVQHLRTIHQYGLLVETMRGDLEIHDLRYLGGTTPLIQFEDHVSSYVHRLGLTVSPGENFLFAGGGDSRLRGWSLRTGQALHTDAVDSPISPSSNPFRTRYPYPIRALEVLADEEKTYLWMASYKHLHGVELGPVGILR
ncbi:hypothetical protein BD414DRAFT_457838 [Trametes punicea]|nr:hypothetical protein BD414DRAFT_457838 [Trametes punicea]